MRKSPRSLFLKAPAVFFVTLGMILIILIISLNLAFIFLHSKAEETAKETIVSPDSSLAEIAINLGEGITMDFVRIENGTFSMGSEEEVGDADETPRHEVNITAPFYMGKYEVTQTQWAKVMGNNPSEFKGENYPVDSVSWKDCQEFMKKLNQITGKTFSLPTEAQWEYCCRAGTATKWFFGDSSESLSLYAWAGEESASQTHPVGLKAANPWGLYDMYGNLQEWCLDWYENPYSIEDISDPAGPEKGDSKVIRGGGWGETPDYVRSAYRNACGAEEKSNGIGFRCVLVTN